MKTAKRPLPHWLILPAVFLGWLVSTATLSAQTATGTVQGHVYNPVSKQYVKDAEVRLEGTTQVTYTTNDGAFQFNNVPAGPATVSVSFTGYDTVKETLNVTAGQPAVREINLVSTAATRSPRMVSSSSRRSPSHPNAKAHRRRSWRSGAT